MFTSQFLKPFKILGEQILRL